MKPGLMIGSAPVPVRLTDTRVDLAPGDTLILYTDGYLEATAPDGKTEFGLDRLREAVGGARTTLTLDACATETAAAIRRYSGRDELQDDQTLVLLRRK